MGKELFDNIPSKVGDLLNDVKNGRIGLPDLQRPFVWKDNKVQQLLDSMLKGYPIGYIMLWESPADFENKNQIGSNTKVYTEARDLVIDGQQRLTALLAALKGIKIKDSKYRERPIRISFNPLTREFAVWSQAYERDPEWISAVSEVFAAHEEELNIVYFRLKYIQQVNESRKKKGLPLLTEEEKIDVEININALLNLSIYLLPTLRINSAASEEDVADIFVRVNSGGQKLTEKNFIETLLAVYDNEIHAQINDFCRQSRIPKDGTSYNKILEVDPVHLIRASVGIAFKRARLRYAYMLMRGKDLQTGQYSAETRETNLQLFREALKMVVNLNNWHAFMNIVAQAGYLKGSMISSGNAVIFAYILYLLGKQEYKISAAQLNPLMKRYIFMVTLTGYYTSSPESVMESQLADLRNAKTAHDFIDYLNNVIASQFTDDYFQRNLINDLKTSSTSSPIWFGYVASLNVLNLPMLFSTTPTSYYFTAGANGSKLAIDIHHIFPKKYLERLGFKNDRDRNQIANYTFLDYTTNIEISDEAPSDYVPKFRSKMGEENYKLACKQNALPENFESLEYMDFLNKRRVLMAAMIYKAYQKLSE